MVLYKIQSLLLNNACYLEKHDSTPPHPPLPPPHPFVFWVFFVVVPYKRASFQGSTLSQHQFSLIFTVVFNIRVVPLYTGASNIHSIQEHQTDILYSSIKHIITRASNRHSIQEYQTHIITRASNRHSIQEYQTHIITRASNRHSIQEHQTYTHPFDTCTHAQWSCQMVLPDSPLHHCSI